MGMQIEAGAADVTTYFALRLTGGGDATGLTIADLDLQYVRSGATPSAKVDAIALAATDSAHADNKGIEIDATDQPGLHRFDWPDAAFVYGTGVREVILTVKGSTINTEHLRVTIGKQGYNAMGETTIATVVDGPTSPVSFTATTGPGDNNAWLGNEMVVYNANGDRSRRRCTSYTAGGAFTIESAFDFDPVAGDKIISNPVSDVDDADAIVQKVWDKVLAGNHDIDGSAGAVLQLVVAIKVITDQMVFSKSGQLDGNMKSINGAEVVGGGTTIDPWNGP